MPQRIVTDEQRRNRPKMGLPVPALPSFQDAGPATALLMFKVAVPAVDPKEKDQDRSPCFARVETGDAGGPGHFWAATASLAPNIPNAVRFGTVPFAKTFEEERGGA